MSSICICEAMRWKNVVPTKPGIYLRKNPAISQIVRQDVFEMGGELCVSVIDGTVRLSKWGGARCMWWFGPIPKPPNQAESDPADAILKAAEAAEAAEKRGVK